MNTDNYAKINITYDASGGVIEPVDECVTITVNILGEPTYMESSLGRHFTGINRLRMDKSGRIATISMIRHGYENITLDIIGTHTMYITQNDNTIYCTINCEENEGND